MNHLPKLIGLMGAAGAGKDTVASLLHYNHGYHGIALAAPIKKMLRALLEDIGADTSYLVERHLKEIPIPGIYASYRHMAQTLGTEWGRALHPNFWVAIAEQHMDFINAGSEETAKIVISDVRYENEAAWVRSQGGVIWRVDRNQAQAVRAHTSEKGAMLVKPDRVLSNHGSMAELASNLNDLLYKDMEAKAI